MLNQGHLSQNHYRPSCACSTTISLLVGNGATLLVPLTSFFYVAPQEETSQGWQDGKVQVAARGSVLMMAIGPRWRRVGVRGSPGRCRRGNVFPVALHVDVSEAFVCLTCAEVRAVGQLKGFQNLTPINYLLVENSWISKKM